MTNVRDLPRAPGETYLRPIPEVVADAVALHAERPAIRNLPASLTYSELADCGPGRTCHTGARRSPSRPRRAPFRSPSPGDLVPARRRQGGAIAVPLTASTPLARRDLVMRDAEPACIVTDMANEHEARALAPQRLPVITIERLRRRRRAAGRAPGVRSAP